MIKIGASLLSADFSRLGREVRRAENGGADFIHLDIMDGHFAPNITFGPDVIKAIRKEASLPFYTHLMIEKPEKYIEQFVQAGSDFIFIHEEACTNVRRTLQVIKKMDVKAGIALKPETPLDMAVKVLDEVDGLLIMTVEPGFSGQAFINAMLSKIKEAKKIILDKGLKIELGVDGGVNVETAPLAVKAGANVLVAGSAIYGQKNVKRAISRIRESISTM